MTLDLAIDIGGTHIRVAVYEEDNLIPVAHHRTKSFANTPGVFDRLVEAVETVWQDKKIDSIGIASPGPLDPYAGIILDTPNIPEWNNFPLAEKISKHFGVPVHMDNDANLAALGEWKFGAGMGHSDLIYITISTGIGGGVICNNSLLQGYHGLGAELGHMIIDINGPLCGCGQNGHLESFSSGPAIVKYFKDQINSGKSSAINADPKLTAKKLAEAASQGDPLALSAFERSAYYLGIGVANLLAMFNPSILIFGGGVSQVGTIVFKPFEKSLRAHVFHPRYMDDLVIKKAALDDDAGLLGALAMLRMKRGEHAQTH